MASITSLRLYQLLVLAGGIACFAWAVVTLGVGGWDVAPLALLAVPVTVVVARFPLVLDQGDGGIEIGFDSAVLMFLACTYSAPAALTLWSVGVLCTQLSSARRRSSKAFNVGVGSTAGAVAILVLQSVRGDETTQPRELLAVALAASAYFVVDYVLSATAISLQSGEPFVNLLTHRGTVLAIGCLVPFDLLGYVGAILLRTSPAWTLLLLSVPLATLLVATRAVTRGRENARRLQVLLDAAVDSQTLADPQQVIDALLEDARHLLRLRDLDVVTRPPTRTELGAQVRGTDDPLWLVAPARARARSSVQADKQALAALAAVSRASFTRLALTDDLVHLARHDPLTHLPNRAVFLDRLHFALHLNRRREHDVVLLFVDLDGFKPVNDRFGHAAGDAVLIAVARRLQANVREGDIVARLGGDEFAVLFEDVQLSEVTTACERILSAIAEGVQTGTEHLVHVSASIGVAPSSGAEQADELLRNADLAMYEAKARGKHRHVVYQPTMLASRLQRLELVEALEAALADDRLTLVYQPVVVAGTGRISGVEALARWRNDGVDVKPEVFIRIAEETGLIDVLGSRVLGQVARDAAAIRTAADGDIKFAVNVSPTQLCESTFAESVAAAIEVMGSGSELVLEITERENVSLEGDVLTTMQTISDLGVGFAIDDFGVGFSSISYLKLVPADIVKVDATLVVDVDRDDKARGLLRSISIMCRALGLDIVVEGVERASQLSVVQEDIPDAFVQGFHLHPPLALDDLLDVLRADRRKVDPSRVATS